MIMSTCKGRRVIRGAALQRVALLIIVLGVAIGAVVYFTRPQRPREANRIVHPAGFSIIKPEGWSPRIGKSDGKKARDSIRLDPDRWIGLAPGIWATKHHDGYDEASLKAAGYSPAMFANVPAWASERKLRREVVRKVFVQLGGDWFEIGVNVPGVEIAHLEKWWQYAESLKIDVFHPTTRRDVP